MQNPLVSIGTGLQTSKQVWSQTLSRATTTRRLLFPRLHLSPNRVLALRLKCKNIHQKLTYRGPFRLAANLRCGRLPILTLQTILKRQDLSAEQLLAHTVATRTEVEWKDILNSLATRGWTTAHLDHWVWILSGENGDERVQRLLSTDDRKPIFLVLNLLRRDEVYRRTNSIVYIIRYIVKNHMATEPASSYESHGAQLKRILTVTQFLIALRRVAHHVRHVWPQSISLVARLAIDYIKSIPNDPHHRHHRTDYRDQCRVFNTAIRYLSEPPPNQPLAYMELHWRAQKLLLAMSDNMERPLIINKASYRAVRQVLTGLKRSRKEKGVAIRYTKTWPPYRQDFDDRDTNRTEEDDRSRSVKARVLMEEAGYSAYSYDQALDALGGTGADFPTIQTRSLSPKQESITLEEINYYMAWAMHVRATRNAQEAWTVFNLFAERTGKVPNAQVYNEMFLKLQAGPVNPDVSPNLLPGDSMETFPPHEANYSEYELARLAPPTVAELYADMLNKGIKPQGIGLLSLVSNAKSIEEGLRYLEDGGIPSPSLQAIAPSGSPAFGALQRIPLASFKSYIQLLCNLQPDHRAAQDIRVNEIYLIHLAIKLVTIRLSPDTKAGGTFRTPWYVILRALARRHIAIINGPAAKNDLACLKLFLDILKSARRCIGMDAELFILLCRAIQKTAQSQLMSLLETERRTSPLLPSTQELYRLVTSSFSYLTTPVDVMPGLLISSQFQFPLGPPHLHSYIRALAYLDAKDDMVNMMFWMFDNYAYINDEADRLSDRGNAMVARTLCAFQAFAGPALEGSEQQQLDDRMDSLAASGGSWRWPTSEEVDGYIRADLSGASEALRRRITARSLRKVVAF